MNKQIHAKIPNVSQNKKKYVQAYVDCYPWECPDGQTHCLTDTIKCDCQKIIQAPFSADIQQNATSRSWARHSTAVSELCSKLRPAATTDHA